MKCFKVTFEDGSNAQCSFPDKASTKHYYETFLRMKVVSIEEISEKTNFVCSKHGCREIK